MTNIETNNTNDLTEFTKLCRFDELTEKQGKKYIVGEVEVAVFKIANEVFALNNICPHQHMSIIHDGFIEEDYVFCPAHCWEFNLKDGKMKTGKKGLDPYEVKIIDGFVYAKVYEKKLCW